MRKVLICSIVIIAGLIYYFFNPVDSAFFPKCPFYALTELKCPGCGSQRAIHSLLHLDLMGALKYNALLVASLPVIGMLIYADINRVKRPSMYIRLHNVKFILGYFAAVVCWWAGRNIFGV